MTENVVNELLLEHLQVMGAELATMSHRPGDLTNIRLEDQKHTRALVRTAGPHEENFTRFQLRLERVERRLDLHA